VRSRASHAVKRSYHIQRDASTFSRCDQESLGSPPLSTSKTVSAEDKPCLKYALRIGDEVDVDGRPYRAKQLGQLRQNAQISNGRQTNMQKQFNPSFTSCPHERNVVSRTMRTYHRFVPLEIIVDVGR
jgi:hypothetical protein